jgi:hypothetical protein
VYYGLIGRQAASHVKDFFWNQDLAALRVPVPHKASTGTGSQCIGGKSGRSSDETNASAHPEK